MAREQKTLRFLPAIARLASELASAEEDYRFSSEAEVYEQATQIGLFVLAAQSYSSGKTLDAISKDQLLGELRVRLLPALDFLMTHGQAPTMIQQPSVAGSSQASHPAPPPSSPVGIDESTGSMLSGFGSSFLDDDED